MPLNKETKETINIVSEIVTIQVLHRRNTYTTIHIYMRKKNQQQ